MAKAAAGVVVADAAVAAERDSAAQPAAITSISTSQSSDSVVTTIAVVGTSVILKVRTASTHALEHLLAQIYALPGVRGTKSFIALSTDLERPVQAEVTTRWPEIRQPE